MSGIKYSPAGATTQLNSGLSSGAITTINRFNVRLQPDTIYAVSPAGTLLSLRYNFGTSANNNGNVYGIENLVDPTRSQSFTYDALDRIATAQTPTSNLWGEIIRIDPWGNLTNREGIVGKLQYEPLNQPAAHTNRMMGRPYDSSGNLKEAGYIYDAEGRLNSAGGVTYTYDGDGKRVRKSNGTTYWTGVSADAIAETDSAGSITNEYVFMGSKRVARVSGGARYYYLADHLGTTRAIIEGTTGTRCYDADFYPYGGERAAYVNTCPQSYKFTGKERDTESELDYFGARNYSSDVGRFLSMDEGPLREDDPQSLNRYAYARNNPVRYIDEDGFYWVEASTHQMFRVYRENSSAAATWTTSKGWGKHIDYFSRRSSGDTNRSSLVPGRRFIFSHDEVVAKFDDPERYSVTEGIQLDRNVFSAFAKEFGVIEQTNLTGTLSYLPLTREEVQQFHEFHTAFRYSQEIDALQRRLEKEKDPAKREQLEKKIQERKNSKEYKKYGKQVEKHAKK